MRLKSTKAGDESVRQFTGGRDAAHTRLDTKTERKAVNMLTLNRRDGSQQLWSLKSEHPLLLHEAERHEVRTCSCDGLTKSKMFKILIFSQFLKPDWPWTSCSDWSFVRRHVRNVNCVTCRRFTLNWIMNSLPRERKAVKSFHCYTSCLLTCQVCAGILEVNLILFKTFLKPFPCILRPRGHFEF